MSLWEIFSTILTFSAGAASGFLVTYFQEKAKNLAIRQDIGRITQEIENVKLQNNLLLEEVRGRHQLRLAALDQRLKVHQQAYALWKKLLVKIYREEKIEDFVIECQDWWHNNCLYLTPGARGAFYGAFLSAALHKDFKHPETDPLLLRENLKRIEDAGEAIVRGVELPALQDESEFLSKVKNSITLTKL